MEQFRWDDDYYHLVNSKLFELNKEIPEKRYSKNGSYFVITKLENEVQTTGRKRG